MGIDHHQIRSIVADTSPVGHTHVTGGSRVTFATGMAMIEAVVVEVPNPTHPYGAKGVGEVDIVPPMAAIANVGRSKTMAARVVFTSGFSRRYTGGVREFTVEARNLRGVIKEMDPGRGEHLEEETTVAIDGAIYEVAYYQPIREGCEILHPQARRRIAAGLPAGYP